MSPVTRSTRAMADVAAGDVLPELPIPLTRTLIVTTAIATRDYQDVHHDPDLAVSRGSPDIFMNILSTNGLVGRYITDWTGPGGIIESVSIRLGAPNYPGDTMVFTGTVTEAGVPEGRADGRGVVEIAVRGANSRGDHVTGVVRVSLPVAAGGGNSGDGSS
ncbi:MAG TPA: MaoC family dehydratase [Acidimicrobiales bacterium]|jgi:acyl dehydratase